MGLRLPTEAHTSRPWRIHEVAHDFRVEDVWALPTPGGPDDLPRLVEGFAQGEPSRGGSAVVRALFALRWWLGRRLHLDDDPAGDRPTLHDRLPSDLRGTADVAFPALPFTGLYLLHDEFAAEIANRTMHGVLHLGWVADGSGSHRGQLAVLVKPNGRLGRAYMAAIRPLRHLLVYPAMLRQIERQWHDQEVAP